MVSSGNVFDREFSCGRLGLYSLSQANVVWSDLQHTCTSQFVTVYNEYHHVLLL